MADAAKTVAITGASGYLASHVVKVFADKGYIVRGTVRDPSKKEKVGHLEAQFPDVQLFKADLLEEDSFKECFTGCDLVIHCASPFLARYDDPQKDLIDPALKGTTNVLDTAVACGVKRVVVTSSCAAIMSQDSVRKPQDFEKKIWTEEDWNDESTLEEGAYRMSKSLAEHKAWEYKEKIEVAVINPAFIMGPSLSSRIDAVSVSTAIGMLDGSFKNGTSGACFGAVDVRDVALAHFRAATIDEAKDHRFVLSSEEGYDIVQLAAMLRPKFSNHPLPTGFGRGKAVTYRPYYSNKKARTILNIDFTPLGITMNDMAEDLISKDMIKSDYTLYYWGKCNGFWGRAIGIKLALDAAGVKYQIKDTKEADFDTGFAVPMLTFPDGQTMSQTLSILDVLGEELGMGGSTQAEKYLCKQTLMDLNDIFGESKNFAEKPDRADKWFKLLENRLKDRLFLVCNEPTVADYHALFAFDGGVFRKYKKMGELEKDYPVLMSYYKRLQNTSVVKAMYSSGIAVLK